MTEESPHVEFGLSHVASWEPTTLCPNRHQSHDERRADREGDDDRDPARSPPPHGENASPCSDGERVAFDES